MTEKAARTVDPAEANNLRWQRMAEGGTGDGSFRCTRARELVSPEQLKEPQGRADILKVMDSSLTGQVTKDYIPNPQIYVTLIQECERLGREGEFYTCFTELQRAFLKQRPPKLKSLIRLVKYWYQEVWPSCPDGS